MGGEIIPPLLEITDFGPPSRGGHQLLIDYCNIVYNHLNFICLTKCIKMSNYNIKQSKRKILSRSSAKSLDTNKYTLGCSVYFDIYSFCYRHIFAGLDNYLIKFVNTISSVFGIGTPAFLPAS